MSTASGLVSVLDDMLGPYEWGKRDCLSVAELLAVRTAGYAPWMDGLETFRHLPEGRAIITAIKAHGSMGAAYRYALHEHGPYERRPFDAKPEPGDLVVLGGRVVVSCGEWSTEGGRQILGIVEPRGAVLVWSASGLTPVIGDPTVRSVYRIGSLPHAHRRPCGGCPEEVS